MMDQANAQALNEQSTVDLYKQALTESMQARATLAPQISALTQTIQGMIDAQERKAVDFNTKALQMYPDLLGKNLQSFMNQLPGNDPLIQLWINYQNESAASENQIKVKMQALNELLAQNKSLLDQETANLNSYADFASSAKTQVPSAQELVSTLNQVSVIPNVDQVSNQISVPAIEDLDPEAAADITLQVAQANGQLDDVIKATTPLPPSPASVKKIPKPIIYGIGAILFLAIFGPRRS